MKKSLFALLIIGQVVFAQHKTPKDNAKTEELDNITIYGKKEKRYNDTISSIATRTATKLIDIPQSIQVISKDIWKDQGGLNLNEVSRNMVGVANTTPYSSFSMRGFNNYGDAYLLTNGMKGTLYHYSQKVLLYNLDQVEIMRGPASVMYAVGNPGGVINLTTKQPLDKARYEVNFTTGSWNLFTGFADATGPLTKDKKLKYRLVVGGENSDSYRNFQYMKNLLITPTLQYDFSENTSLNVDYTYLTMNSRFQYDRGTYIKKKADGSYDFDNVDPNFTTQGSPSFGKDKNSSASLTFKHKFNDKLSFALMSRYVRRNLDMLDVYGFGPLNATQDSIPREGTTWKFNTQWIANTAFLKYNFKTSKFISHELIVGADIIQDRVLKNLYVSKVYPSLSIDNPDYSQDAIVINDPNVPLGDEGMDNNTKVTNNYAGFIQDQISIGEKWKLNLAVRYNEYRYKQKPVDELDATGVEITSDANAWIPRVGLVYELKKNIALYASYTESFEPQNNNNVGAGGPFPPKKGKQYEVGYKGDFFSNRLSTTLALYDIDYVNILVADPSDPNKKRRIAIPGLNSKGIEVSVQGIITQNWSVIGSYSYNEVKYLSKTSIGNVGDRPLNAPKYVGNVWVEYNFTETILKNLKLGAGIRFQGNTLGGSYRDDSLLLPAYSYIDMSANYRYKNYIVGVTANNITDKLYFPGAYGTTSLFTGTPQNIRLNLGFVF
ncbi:TonB-dependent siderophore receptor [Flavobacterium hydatis]|uniref:TonB-dependent siderophore receptor n=1 Tax=Flavobacterium hydatis TaxID=991 RepID=A0ABX4CHV7_FLAHY|nr:TonB-dependent siderophore receptor [Flavobacterium hydatis]OXA94228.1 TonB-dependent siderophore receptor [Flavobacterium hydatis]